MKKPSSLFKLPNWHNWHNNNVAGLQAETALYTGNVTDGGNDGSQQRFIQIPA
jgi:hypothetical protein